MIIPRFLSAGDAIGVTAPSAGVTESTDRFRFANARRRIEARGYRVVETPNTYMCDEEGRSSPAAQRVEEFESVLEDPEVAAIYAASGGDYEFEMLPLMDWKAVEDNPKWIQGYSDNTVLLFKITAEHDIA
ncbi:MAG: LD-carboxypeptidase, partial [Thermoplasmata archaeon]|nr:LD-carboxypeptidase [Thermoplasmata archaeon]